MHNDSDFNDLFQDFFSDDNAKKATPNASEPEVPPSAPKPIFNPNQNTNLPENIDIDALLNSNSTPPLPLKEKHEVTGGSIAVPTPNPNLLIPRSMEVDEILSYVPNWMIRWGITVIFALLIGILVMSWVIKYPDVAEGQMQLISDTPPVEVVTKASGSIGLIYKDKAKIKKGKTFAYIKNDAEIYDVKNLKKSIKSLNAKIETGEDLSDFELPKGLKLGMLQGSFSELESALLNDELQAKAADNTGRQKTNIHKQLKQMKRIQKDYEERVDLLLTGHERSKTILEKRYRPLYRKGSISREQFDEREEQVNTKFENLQMAKSTLNEHKKRIIEIRAQLDELDFTKSKNELQSGNAIGLALQKLENDVKVWENRYLLRAPTTGRLNYLNFVKNDSHIDAEKPLASIAPMTAEGKSQSEAITGELLIPENKVGEVKIGQEVNIELDAYPKKEYGVLVGQVAEIADVKTTVKSMQGSENFYKVKIELTKGLTTTLDKNPDFKHNMSGKAQIITKDKRLIERFFYQLREVLDKMGA